MRVCGNTLSFSYCSDGAQSQDAPREDDLRGMAELARAQAIQQRLVEVPTPRGEEGAVGILMQIFAYVCTCVHVYIYILYNTYADT